MATLNESASVDADDVREIITTNMTDSEINGCINIAYFLSIEVGKSSAVSDDLLAEIEKYLAAHFITVSEGQPKSQSIQGVSVSFMGKDGSGLKGSRYGQTAIALDLSGYLAKRAEGIKKARVEVWRRSDE
jgi:hypothetical protein